MTVKVAPEVRSQGLFMFSTVSEGDEPGGGQVSSPPLPGW